MFTAIINILPVVPVVSLFSVQWHGSSNGSCRDSKHISWTKIHCALRTPHSLEFGSRGQSKAHHIVHSGFCEPGPHRHADTDRPYAAPTWIGCIWLLSPKYRDTDPT